MNNEHDCLPSRSVRRGTEPMEEGVPPMSDLAATRKLAAAARPWVDAERDSEELRELFREAADEFLEPLWEVFLEVQSQEPLEGIAGVPHLWRWSQLRDKAVRAAELVPIGRGGERRALMLVNPAFPSLGRSTHTLCAGIQIILPGDAAPAHRHTPSALRLILEGSGAYTAIDGEKVYMEPGDVLLTPAMAWHDHRHEGEGPMIWMDVLDIPLVNMLNASFFDLHEDVNQPITKPPGWSHQKYGAAAMRPAWEPSQSDNPLLVYKWQETESALRELAASGESSPFDGVAMQYVNPATGGPVAPTLDAWMAQLAPGQHTRAHRHTPSVVYHVYAGSGYSVVAGQRFDWSKGDYFVVPPWTWHEHVNSSASNEAQLFSVNDSPALRALGLVREEAFADNDGRQAVAG